MHKKLTSIVFKVAKILAWCVAGGFFTLLSIFVFLMENRADLSIWHTVNLDTEFTTESEVENFADYLGIEDRVFEQLDERVFDQVPTGPQQIINRFSRGSLSNPERWPQNWNRTFKLPSPSPDTGVLLLHGMSDSPYSLKSIGERLHAENAWVLGLRYPGHGTAPAGITSVRWQDMARAIELAMAELRKNVGDKPIYIVGYSVGGALAVHYALKSLEDSQLPRIKGVVLISPAIGVTPLAALAVWQARLGHVLGLEKLKWADIKLEYDPYKFNSFPVNAGDQVYRLTEEISRLITARREDNSLSGLPTLLAFQSSVDATVSSKALMDGLFNRLSPGRHELVLFDINRQTDIEQLLQKDPQPHLDAILENNTLPFTLSVIRNRSKSDRTTSIFRRPEGGAPLQEITTKISWPRDIFSLSHIALPFSKNDDLYGKAGATSQSGVRLGDLALRGERGVVRIPPGDMLRLRWNPFYPLIEQQILQFVKK
jgi:alpha-beta hydrolase superfamily lysophospholipase